MKSRELNTAGHIFSSEDRMKPKRRPLPIESTTFEEIELIKIHMFTQLEYHPCQCCLFNVGWGVNCVFYRGPFAIFLFGPSLTFCLVWSYVIEL